MPQWEYCSIRHTDGGIEYALYRTNGAYIALLCGPFEDDTGTYFTTWQDAIATLGIYGWEAINTLPSHTTYENWYFRRPIQQGYQYPSW